ncbi:uncharacterized protein LOC144151672 [Haemaphysalis longicornis]
MDERHPQPPSGAAFSTDTRLADALEDSALRYLNDSVYDDVLPARRLLTACGTASARDLAAFVAVYVPPAEDKVLSADASTIPVYNLGAGPQALVRAATARTPESGKSPVLLLLPGVDLKQLEGLVSSGPRKVLQYVGFRAALWAAPFVSAPPEALLQAHMLTQQPPIARKRRVCSRAVGRAVPLVYLRALRGALGPLTLARAFSEQLEDRFLRSLPRVLGPTGPDAHLVAHSVRFTPLARFFPARVAEDSRWNAHRQGLNAAMARAANALDMVRLAAANADRTGGWPLDVRPVWLPGGALRLPPGLFDPAVPINSSLRALHMARVGVRLYATLAALVRDIPGVSDTPVRESQEKMLWRVARCLSDDLYNMPTSLKSGFEPAKGGKALGWALYDQATGLALAHENLAPMLDTRRIWGLDLRLKGLEQMSSDQLFFVYYALDNCQRSDAQAQRRLGWTLAGQERVNTPLRHWPPFARHFGCHRGQPMVAQAPCGLLQRSGG